MNMKIEGYIWAKKDRWDNDFRYHFYAGDGTCSYLTSEGYIPIAPYTIEIEIPKDIDLYKAGLKSLQVKRKLIVAENEKRLTDIDREISEFTAIEHKQGE